MLCVWRAELTEVNTRWNRGKETKMSSQGLGHRSTETAEKSRMAGKRLAKFGEKGATESRNHGEEQNGWQKAGEIREKGATESRTRIFFASGGACGGLRCQ